MARQECWPYVPSADSLSSRKEEASPPGKPKFVPCTEAWGRSLLSEIPKQPKRVCQAGKGSGLLKLVSDSPEPSEAPPFVSERPAAKSVSAASQPQPSKISTALLKY